MGEAQAMEGSEGGSIDRRLRAGVVEAQAEGAGLK